MLQKAKTLREKALFVLLWRVGLRANEACSVKLEDFELLPTGAYRLHVTNGKGGKERFCSIGPKYAKYIKRYIGKRKRGWFLVTRDGRRMHVSQTRRTIAHIGKRAQCLGPVSPHRLRHAFARDLIDEGYTVVDTSDALGHTNVGTTNVYLQYLGILTVADKLATRE